MRTRVFTPDILESIPKLVALGESSEQIAARIGCSQKSLIVTCCKHKISLRRNPAPPSKRPDAPRNIRLRPHVLDAFESHAPGHSVDLVERLLTVIARDDLIKAVLDEEATA